MSEYIDRQKLLEAYDRAHQGPPGDARRLIQEAPTEDVAHVVTCRKCKYWRTRQSYSHCMLGHYGDGKDWYCPDGEHM